MAVVRVCRPNPADPKSGLKLLSSGAIQAYGNSLPPADWVIPESFNDKSAWDMVVIDHLTPSGYVLSGKGTVLNFGGVTPAVGYQDFGRLALFRKILMNPSGNGQGYEMDVLGRLYRFGPTQPPFLSHHASVTPSGALAGGINWGEDIAVDVHMDWSTKRYAILSDRGHLYSPDFTITWDVDDPRPLQTGRSLYRALAFVNPAIPVGDTPGYIATYTGRIFGFNSAEHIRPFAVYPDRDVVVDLNVTSDGRAGRPLILEVATDFGSRNDLTVSVAPTLVLTEPATPVTNTTRPRIVWAYSDPDGDAQASVEVRLYEDTGSAPTLPPTVDPLYEWTVTDRGTFLVEPEVDLPNGDFWIYARATDTAGDSSLWAFRGFVQNVTPPPAPSVTTDPDSESWSTSITVEAGMATAGGLSAVVEGSDDDWFTWFEIETVAYPLTGPKIVEVTDFTAPFNIGRAYRARTAQLDPALTSAPSTPVEETVISDEFVLTIATTGEGEALSWIPTRIETRDSGAVALNPVGRSTAVAVRNGTKGKTIPAKFRTMSHQDDTALTALLDSGVTLLLRDPYRSTTFVSVVGDVTREMIDGLAPEPGEVTSMRHAHEHSVSFAEVSRP